jgi:hypothetical protein
LSVETLMRVEAPHFVAGYLVRSGRVVFAAPILKWAVGKTDAEVRAYCARKGWKADVVPEK